METFQSINEWLNEQKEDEKTYGCVMLEAKVPDWEEMHIGGIDPKDVYTKPYDDSFGLEKTPHVTVIYGIHEDEIDPEIIFDVIQKKMEPLTVTIDKIGIFETDDYDVVKYDVPVVKKLKKFRNLFLKSFPNTQTFPEYHPHVTLAYVKPGEGKKYVKKLEEPFEITFDKGVYSFHEKNKDGEIETVKKQHVFPEKDE